MGEPPYLGLMSPRQTSLERAFELARSGECANLAELRERLKAEGFASQQLEGPSLLRQLRELCRIATLARSA
jgi:hypothetical protein